MSLYYRVRSDRNAPIHALVAGGIGAAVLPALAVNEADDQRLAVRSLEHPLPPRTLRLARQQDRHLREPFGAFVELAHRVGTSIGEELHDCRPVLAEAA